MPNTENYIELITTSLAMIKSEYFKILTTYEDNGIVRERVFCYELYHQIRKNQELDFNRYSLVINGEIDKRGHDEFLKEHQINPDFVFHMQGNMESNTLIIEVKGIIRNDDGIKKDLTNINTFISNYNYEKGVFIIYNHSLAELKEHICEKHPELIELSESHNIECISKLIAGPDFEKKLLKELLEER